MSTKPQQTKPVADAKYGPRRWPTHVVAARLAAQAQSESKTECVVDRPWVVQIINEWPKVAELFPDIDVVVYVAANPARAGFWPLLGPNMAPANLDIRCGEELLLDHRAAALYVALVERLGKTEQLARLQQRLDHVEAEVRGLKDCCEFATGEYRKTLRFRLDQERLDEALLEQANLQRLLVVLDARLNDQTPTSLSAG